MSNAAWSMTATTAEGEARAGIVPGLVLVRVALGARE